MPDNTTGLGYTYPADCITPEQKSKYRRQQRKLHGTLQQRSTGTAPVKQATPRMHDTSTGATVPGKTYEQLFGTYSQVVDGKNTKCKRCRQPIKDFKTAEQYNGYWYHHTCTPAFDARIPGFMRNDYRWIDIPLPIRELGLRRGLTADIMAEQLKEFGKPVCGICGEHLYPWNEMAEVVIESQHVIVHSDCMDEDTELA